MKTWLNSFGEWHQKLSDWANEDGISAWRSAFRLACFIALDTTLWMVVFWGIFMMFITTVGRLFIKPEVEE